MVTRTSARVRYEAIREERPALFANPPNAPYEILTSSAMMDQAEAAEAARLKRDSRPESWSHCGVVYEDKYQILLRDAVRRPDGSLGTYARSTSASAAVGAAVLPVLNDKVVLLRHFRHATRSEHLEIPRGFGEPGATAEEQAYRELSEETGSAADELIPLGGIHPNTGSSADLVELFFARVHQTGAPEAAEGIAGLELIEAAKLANMISDGKITDAFTITAWARASLRGLLPS
jgi:ADP-ribose pyrophosphatase